MDNHYHLVIHTHQGHLSRLLRQINGVYSQAYNRRHKKVGHVFQGKFKAILVNSDAYLLEVCRYVELNPVRAKMVMQPDDWQWSSYGANTGRQPVPDWLETATVHGYLLGHAPGDIHDVATAARRYATLVQQGKGDKLWETSLRQQVYLGDEDFVKRMQALLNLRRKADLEVPGIQRREKTIPISEYLQAYDRDKAIMLAYQEGRHTMTAIARALGLSVARVRRLIALQAKGKT